MKKQTDLQKAKWRTMLEALGIATAYIVCIAMMLRSFRPQY